MDDLHAQLRGLGFKTPRLQKNPVTYDWVLVSDFLRDHAAAMGAWARRVAEPVDETAKGTTD